MRYRQTTSNEITISRVANGWAVRMPEQYEPTQDPNEMGNAMASGIKAMEPFITELYSKLHKDPLLDKLQNPEESNEESENMDKKLQELSRPVIGQDESIYVFQTFNEVLNHLNQRFVDEDGD